VAKMASSVFLRVALSVRHNMKVTI